MRRVRIYIEGKKQRHQNELKKGFESFLADLRKSVKPDWDIKLFMRGSRWDAFEDFQTAQKLHADDFCVCLIDSEWAVTKPSPLKHLAEKETWKMKGLNDNQCYLMVQTTEAWFFADIPAIQKHYGQHFNLTGMGKTVNIEKIPKLELYKRLASATAKKENRKGEYHKGNHSGALLGKIDPTKVRAASPHCDRIFTEIPKAVAQL